MENRHSSTTTIHVYPGQPADGVGRPEAIEIYNGKSNLKYYALCESEVPYAINLVNDTNEYFYFAVYQDFPLSPGLQSIAWQVRRLPKRGSQPTHSKVSWSLSYGITIANWDVNGREYTGDQHQDAELGKQYQVISDREFPLVDPNPIGVTKEEQIQFSNKTVPPNAQELDMGFTIAGNIVAVQSGVHANESVLFDVHPTYYVACYRRIKLGQFVDSDIILGPVQVAFRDGITTMNVEAFMDAGQYKMKTYQ